MIVESPCPACGGRGCGECGQSGNCHVRECPQKFVTVGTREFVRLAAWAGTGGEGSFPAGGGTGDQADGFLEAAELLAWATKEAGQGVKHGRAG